MKKATASSLASVEYPATARLSPHVCNFGCSFNPLLGSLIDLVFHRSWLFSANRNSLMFFLFAFLFSNMSVVIFYVMGTLRLGLALICICCKLGSDFLRQLQKFRRLLRRVHCSLWRNISSQPSFGNLKILVVMLWVVGLDLYIVCLMGLICDFWQRSKQSISSAVLTNEQFKVSPTTFASVSDTPKSSRYALFSLCGVGRISLSLVLDSVCIIMLVSLVLLLPVLGLVLKTKTLQTRSRLSSSSYTTSTVTTSPTLS